MIECIPDGAAHASLPPVLLLQNQTCRGGWSLTAMGWFQCGLPPPFRSRFYFSPDAPGSVPGIASVAALPIRSHAVPSASCSPNHSSESCLIPCPHMLQASLGLAATADAPLTLDQRARLVTVYAALAKAYPRSSACKRIPLDFAVRAQAYSDLHAWSLKNWPLSALLIIHSCRTRARIP